MIYTVTFNPAIDYLLYVPTFKIGSINRSAKENVFCGGKGINVSIILKELGIDSTATGFTAGFTGNALEQSLKSKAINTDFIHLKNGITRINVKIRSDRETDINGQGPEILNSDITLLTEKLSTLGDNDYLVLAGSIPDKLPKNIYEKIMQSLSDRNVKFVVDATGELLKNSLKFRPFLIKPNADELGELFGTKIKTEDEALFFAEKLKNMGALNVLVSMGKDGAVLVDEYGKRHKRKAVSGKTVNTVGAGDSMVAGFVAGYIKTDDYDFALNLGTAAGSATAFSEGLAKKEEILKYLEK